jgi:hypothetical protein
MIRDKIQALDKLIELLEEKEEYELCYTLMRWKEGILMDNDTPLELTPTIKGFLRGYNIDIDEL